MASELVGCRQRPSVHRITLHPAPIKEGGVHRFPSRARWNDCPRRCQVVLRRPVSSISVKLVTGFRPLAWRHPTALRQPDVQALWRPAWQQPAAGSGFFGRSGGRSEAGERLRLGLIEPQQTYQFFPAGRDLVLGDAQAVAASA